MKRLGAVGDLVVGMAVDRLWTGSRVLSDDHDSIASDWDVLLLVRNYSPARKALEEGGWSILSNEAYNINGLPLLVFEQVTEEREKFNILMTTDEAYYKAFTDAHNLACILRPKDKYQRLMIFYTVIKQKFQKAERPKREDYT